MCMDPSLVYAITSAATDRDKSSCEASDSFVWRTLVGFVSFVNWAEASWSKVRDGKPDESGISLQPQNGLQTELAGHEEVQQRTSSRHHGVCPPVKRFGCHELRSSNRGCSIKASSCTVLEEKSREGPASTSSARDE